MPRTYTPPRVPHRARRPTAVAVRLLSTTGLELVRWLPWSPALRPATWFQFPDLPDRWQILAIYPDGGLCSPGDPVQATVGRQVRGQDPAGQEGQEVLEAPDAFPGRGIADQQRREGRPAARRRWTPEQRAAQAARKRAWWDQTKAAAGTRELPHRGPDRRPRRVAVRQALLDELDARLAAQI